MLITPCQVADVPTILKLYEAARNLQTMKKMVVWPNFDSWFIEAEIRENRQWKLVSEDEIACNWAITFADKEIWEERDKGDAIYIHRLVTNPDFRGKKLVKQVVDWAKAYAQENQKKYVRLDTLGNNTGLIKHYTDSGFDFLGIVKLTNTQTLPLHYQQEPNCCLFELAV